MLLTAAVTALIAALAATGALVLFGFDTNPAVVAGIAGGVTGAVVISARRKPGQDVSE